MKPRNPDDETLEETSGSSRFFSFSQESDGVASDDEVEAPESTGGDSLNCVGAKEVMVNNGVENFAVVNEGREKDAEEENEGLSRGVVDTVRKIEVSGENISLVVDFSGSLTGFSRRNAFESSGGNLTVSMEKQNGEEDQELGFVVGDIVWVLKKHRNWWPGEVIDIKTDRKESMMVSCFGESNAFLWCSPAQVRPFSQNIENMLKQRTGRSFSRAVEIAMAVLGDSLKLEMTRTFISRGNGQSAESSDDIRNTKPSVLRAFSADQMNPEELVDQLKDLAKSCSHYGLLELTIMQSRLSAFYSFLGHKQIHMRQLCKDNSKEKEDGAIDVMKRNCSRSRDRKRSKYLSYPFVDSDRTEGKKVVESNDGFAGSASAVTNSSRKRFQREWCRKFMIEEAHASNNHELSNGSVSDLLSELRLLAMNCLYSEKADKFHLTEWFFSKFRMSVFHDEYIYGMQLKNMTVEKDSILADDMNPDAAQKIFKRKNSAKSKIRSLSGLSDVNSDPGTHGLPKNDSQGTISEQTPSVKAFEADSPRRTVTLVPDLNCRSPTDLPERSRLGGETRSMLLSFQATTGQCSTDRPISRTWFGNGEPGSDMSACDANSGQKKRTWKRKRNEEPVLLPPAAAIPDLNRTTTDTAILLPQEKPMQQRRKRLRKEESSNGETKGATILLLKFASGGSLPSQDDLASTFSGFGPLDATQTYVSRDSCDAQVAFMSSDDAIEAVKSLEKGNPFGETRISYRLQQKPATILRKVPGISSPVSLASRPCEPPMSVGMIRQNLMMMTSMLEHSGESLSEEMRTKLKCEITGLLEKVSSMPTSSSS